VVQAFCDVLATFLLALQGVDATDDRAGEGVCITSSELSGEGSVFSAAVSLSGTHICDLPVTSAVMQQFIDVAAQDRCCFNLLCEREVCLFFWGALRF
jgi:hypothetical protein